MDRTHDTATTPNEPDSRSNGKHDSPVNALKALSTQLAELKTYLAYFVTARTDAIKLSLRNAALYAGLALFGAVVLSALAVTAVVLLSLGLAQGLTVLFGGRQWLGNLVFGSLLSTALGLAAYFGLARFIRKSRAATMGKYERMKRQQLQQFGHDIHERAQSTEDRARGQ